MSRKRRKRQPLPQPSPQRDTHIQQHCFVGHVDPSTQPHIIGNKPKTSNRYVVYVIKCTSDVWYVGITHCLMTRFNQHKTGKRGANITRRHTPLTYYIVRDGLRKKKALKVEQHLTIQLLKHGYNVYGGSLATEFHREKFLSKNPQIPLPVQ